MYLLLSHSKKLRLDPDLFRSLFHTFLYLFVWPKPKLLLFECNNSIAIIQRRCHTAEVMRCHIDNRKCRAQA